MFCGKCGKTSSANNEFCTGCGERFTSSDSASPKKSSDADKSSSRRSQNKSDFSFSVVKHIGVLSEGAKGWRKELNIVSWNDRGGKLDIRDWSPERDKMGRGVTLSKDEVSALRNLLNEYEDAENE